MYINLLFFITMLTINTNNDPITRAINNYKNVESYSVTLKFKKNNSNEIIKYYFKRPGFVKMEFIKPHKGAVLVYNPLDKKVRIRPFSFFNSFILTLNPGNPIIKDEKDRRVDESDIGVLLELAKIIKTNGELKILKDENIGKKSTILIKIEGKGNFTIQGIHYWLLWLDKNNYLPLKAIPHDIKGNIIEEVLMDDIKINIKFNEDFFSLL